MRTVLRLVVLVLLGAIAWAQTESWHVIELPAGDTVGFSIDFDGWSGHAKKYRSSEWAGKTGVLFKGAGAGKTHIRPAGLNGARVDATVLVARHAGRVAFQGVTIHGGARQAVFFGQPGPVVPTFRLEMTDCEVLADPPPPSGARSVWGLFGYQGDATLLRVKIDWTEGTEHASYWHGYASRWALRWTNVDVLGSGSQQFKVRNSPDETLWVEGPWIFLTDCTFTKHMQPWTWRGPGFVVLEGASASITATRCLFTGGPGERAKSFMVDDAGGNFRSWNNGVIGRGYANGHVVVKDCGFYAGPGGENYSDCLRVAGNGPGASLRYVARSVTVTGCGAYGERCKFSFGNIPTNMLKVSGCNTPAIKAFAEAAGFDTTHEMGIPTQNRVIPLSEGYAR